MNSSEKRIKFNLFRKKNAKKKYASIEPNNRKKANIQSKKSRRAAVIRNRVLLLAVFVSLIAVLAFVVLQLMHPVGVFEYLSHRLAISGSGDGYTIDIEGGPPSDIVDADGVYYSVSDYTLNCYTFSGKTVFENNHSYKKPVLCTSDTRYLLYGQGESGLTIGTVRETLYADSFDHGILCADIADSGHYAVATNADGYEASVSVFDKKNRKIFEWFSSQELVNSVALSPNGKTLAVATVMVQNGTPISNVYVMNYKSPSPLFSKNYHDEIIFDLRSVSNSVFCTVFSDNLDFIDFKKQSVLSHESEYTISMIKQFGGRTVAIRTAAANRDESIVEIYNAKGKLASSFEIDAYINDFSYKSGKIYLLSRSVAEKYDNRGKLLSRCDVEHDAVFIQVISDNKIACVRNGNIEKFSLNKAEN